MNKIELQQYLNKGYRMTHEYFSDDEYIYLKDGEIHDENGYRMRCNGPNNQVITFWTDRQGPEWNDGWSIYCPKDIEIEERIPILNCDYPITMGYPSPVYFSHKSHKRTNKRH